MFKLKRIPIYVSAILLAGNLISCSDESPEMSDGNSHHRFAVSISVGADNTPIVDDADPTRAFFYTRAGDDTPAFPGDAGYDARLKAPRFVYVWAFPTMQDAPSSGTYVPYILYQKIDTGADNTASWDFIEGQAPTPDLKDDHYRLHDVVIFDTGKTGIQANSDIVIYAMASENDIEPLIPEKFRPADNTKTSAADMNQLADLKAMQLDLSSWITTTAKAHSDALRDLYSTPKALETNHTLKADENGIVQSSIESDNPNVVKLYHCAAKVDMKWEVAPALQQTTWVNSITLTSLPSKLNVFTPTANPTGGTTSCTMAAAADAVETITPGNQWIGRTVAYVLQPPSKPISYTVTFSGTGARPDVTTSTAPATNATYTTWFRVNAKIK